MDFSLVCRKTVRRYSTPLRAGHKAAHLFTETTMYRYVEDLQTPKRWFVAHVDRILELYGQEYQLQKEDLFLGKLRPITCKTCPDSRHISSHRHARSSSVRDVRLACAPGLSAPLRRALPAVLSPLGPILNQHLPRRRPPRRDVRRARVHGRGRGRGRHLAGQRRAAHARDGALAAEPDGHGRLWGGGDGELVEQVRVAREEDPGRVGGEGVGGGREVGYGVGCALAVQA